MALTDNIQGYWKMDVPSGDVPDSTGNNNTLTNVNTVTYPAGKINSGASFAASSSQKLSIADASQTGLDISGDMSISLWVKPVNDNSGRTMVAKSGAAGHRGYVFRFDDDTTLRLEISVDGTAQTAGLWTITALSTSVFTHLVGVYTASVGHADLYINNVAQSTQTGLDTSQNNNDSPFCVGGTGNNVNFMNGVVDEVGIWSRTLSAGEVSTLYNGGAGVQYPFNTSGLVTRKSLLGVGI